MTPLPDEQPLSRRQLREQQRTTESIPIDPGSRPVSTPAVTGGDIPDVTPAPEPQLSTDEVAELEEAEAAGRPLTRRQARDLERVRTASLNVIRPDSEESEADAAAPAAEDESAPVESEIEPASTDDVPPAPPAKPSKKTKRAPSGGANRAPSLVPSSAPAPVEVVDAEIVPAEDTSHAAAVERPTPNTESAFGPAATAQARQDSDSPQLSSSFGQAVLSGGATKAPTVEQPFDQIIARGLEEAGNGVNTSSIILPSMPNSHPLTGPLSANGNVVITGSIDLPSGLSSSGAHPDHFDRSDIDAMFDAEDETRPATAGTPVSASKAVSTHTATRDVITPPAPARSNRLLLILAITAGVLAVAVLSVIIVGIAAGAFQSR
jgi:hypothetical protein